MRSLLLCGLVGALLGCSKEDPTRKALRTYDACVTAIQETTARVQAETSRMLTQERRLEDPPPEPPDVWAEAGELAHACAPLYKRPVCRDAWRKLAAPGGNGRAPLDVCIDAYCPDLPEPRPALCGEEVLSPEAYADAVPELQYQIWRLDWGAKAADAMRRRATEIDLGLPDLAELAAIADRHADENQRGSAVDQATISVLLDGSEIWVGVETGEMFRIGACSEAPDLAALARLLCDLRARPDLAAQSQLELAAEGGVSYQGVVDAMDVAVSTGFRDVGFVDHASLGMSLPPPADRGDRAGHRPARCGQAIASCEAASSAPAPAGNFEVLPPGSGDEGLKEAPIIILTPDNLTFGGMSIETSAIAKQEAWKIQPLATGLETWRRENPGAPDGVVILQADKSIRAAPLNKVIKTAHAAGYPNVMFAVNRRGSP